MFKNLLKITLELKIEIIVLFLLFSIGSITYALSLDNIYRSSAKIFPENSTSSSLNNLGGISSLANIAGLGSMNDSDEETIAIETLKSREFILHFINNRQLEPYLLAFESTDGRGNIKFDDKKYNNGKWLSNSVMYDGKVSNQKLYESLKNSLYIGKDLDTGSYNISIESRDPVMSFEILTNIIEDLDTYLKDKQMEITKERLLYLQSNANSFASIKQREYLDSLVYEELVKLMRLELNDFYSFSLIDKPFYPEKKIKPKRTYIVLFAMLIYTLIIFIRIVNHKKIIES